MLGLALHEIDIHGCLLESPLQIGPKRSILEVWDTADDLDLTNIVECLSPFALVKVSGSEDDVVSAVLWSELDTLLVVLFNQLYEVSPFDILLDLDLVFTEVLNLKEH